MPDTAALPTLLNKPSDKARKSSGLDFVCPAAPMLNPKFLHSAGYDFGVLIGLNKGSRTMLNTLAWNGSSAVSHMIG